MGQEGENALTSKARESVFQLLKYRIRSEQEIRSKLQRKGFSDPIIDQTVAYFKDIGLVDDRDFARQWVASRLARPYGRRRIRFELQQKGIEAKIIQDLLESSMDDDTEDELVRTLARKQIKKYSELDDQKKRKRIYGYLSRRGFESGAILKAIQDL